MLIWDETKRRQNITKHGIDFAELLDVFERPNCTEVDDGQQTELRYRTHFFHHGRIAQLIWMERGRNVRFISCRFTGPGEARRYCQELLQRGGA